MSGNTTVAAGWQGQMMREYWDKWGWVAVVAVVLIVTIRLAAGRAAFCGAETDECLREWVSALGGWAAVAAAIPTVIFLSRQVTDARSHHRENLRSQQQRSYAIARRAEGAVEKADRSLTQLINITENNREYASLAELQAHFRDVVEALQSLDFVAFENEFGPPDYDDIDNLLEQLKVGASEIEDLLSSHTADTTLDTVEDRVAFIRYSAEFIQEYLNGCREMITAAIEEYRALMAPLRRPARPPV